MVDIWEESGCGRSGEEGGLIVYSTSSSGNCTLSIRYLSEMGTLCLR